MARDPKYLLNVLAFIVAVIMSSISFYSLYLKSFSQCQLMQPRFPFHFLHRLGHALGKLGEVYKMSRIHYLQVLGLLPGCLHRVSAVKTQV